MLCDKTAKLMLCAVLQELLEEALAEPLMQHLDAGGVSTTAASPLAKQLRFHILDNLAQLLSGHADAASAARALQLGLKALAMNAAHPHLWASMGRLVSCLGVVLLYQSGEADKTAGHILHHLSLTPLGLLHLQRPASHSRCA